MARYEIALGKFQSISYQIKILESLFGEYWDWERSLFELELKKLKESKDNCDQI